MFTLTDTNNIACHGTSFGSLLEAKNYAINLQKFGLCKSYSIGQYTKDGHIEVYNSSKDGVVDRPSWDEYFLGLAIAVSVRSHDAQTKHGCIIAKDNRILGVGYNGFPRDLDDKYLPSTREAGKYSWMIHSEINAVSNCILRPEDATAYITGEPCNNCLMHLWQNGVKRIVFMNRHGSFKSEYYDKEVRAVFLSMSKMELIPYKKEVGWICINDIQRSGG